MSFGVYKRQEGTAVKPTISPPDNMVSGSFLAVESPFLRRGKETAAPFGSRSRSRFPSHFLSRNLTDGGMMHATEQALFLGRNLNIYEKCSIFGDNALEQACHEHERIIHGLTVTSRVSRRITQPC